MTFFNLSFDKFDKVDQLLSRATSCRKKMPFGTFFLKKED